MKDEEYRRQQQSETRPIQRGGASWWVGAFMVALVTVGCCVGGVLLVLGA